MKEVRLYLPDDVKEVAYWDSEHGKLAKQPVETDSERMAKVVQEFIKGEFPKFEEDTEKAMKDVVGHYRYSGLPFPTAIATLDEVRPRPLMSPVSRSEFVSLTERVSKLEEKLSSQLVKVTKL